MHTNQKESFNWLHFSDLHLKPDTEVSFDTSRARRRLLEFLRTKTTADELPWDYLFITGDIANRNDYSGSKDFIDKMLEALKWTNNNEPRVFWAVGNHDISQENTIRNTIINSIRDSDDGEGLFVTRMNRTDDCSKVLCIQGMNVYKRWHKVLMYREANSPKSTNPHVVYRLPNLNLIVLNTCLASCDSEDEHRLFICDSNLHDLFNNMNPNNPTFVIGHHGNEFFTRKTQETLGFVFDDENVDLYLCGHSHRVGHMHIPVAGRDIHQITCGGGLVDDYSKFSFMHGCYDSEKNEVIIVPYSYSEKGNKNWQRDDSLHRRLDGKTPLRLTGRKPSAKSSKHGGIEKSENKNPVENLLWTFDYLGSTKRK